MWFFETCRKWALKPTGLSLKMLVKMKQSDIEEVVGNSLVTSHCGMKEVNT